MRRIVRLARWIAGAIAFVLAARWTLEAIRGPRPFYGVDAETGLQLRIAPLSPAERAEAIALEDELASGAAIAL